MKANIAQFIQTSFTCQQVKIEHKKTFRIVTAFRYIEMEMKAHYHKFCVRFAPNSKRS